jgi:hypothetical protein
MLMRMMGILITILFFTPDAFAEIYKYRDQNGVLRFTDNLAEVPLDQREKVEQYQEIKTSVASGVETTSEDEPKQDLKALEKALLSEKEVLDQEYKDLTQTRDMLEAIPQPKTPEENAGYQKSVEDYNSRLAAYEEKQQMFREKLAEYEAAIAKSKQ